MSQFTFLDRDVSIGGLQEEDVMASYFKMRQNAPAASDHLPQRSSLSVLSLNNASFNDPPLRQKTPNKSCDIFKKPKTPPRPPDKENKIQVALADADDMMAKAMRQFGSQKGLFEEEPVPSPQTPRQFYDELNSLTPDSIVNFTGRPSVTNSLLDFPVRDAGDAIKMLEKAQKKFIPNSSGFSHNSDITHFSGFLPQDNDSAVGRNFGSSLGDFFAARSTSLAGLLGEKKESSPSKYFPAVDSTAIDRTLTDKTSNDFTVARDRDETLASKIQRALMRDLSGTAICEQLLESRSTVEESTLEGDSYIVKDLTVGGIPMVQSTPMAPRPRVLHDTGNETPIRRVRPCEPRLRSLDSTTRYESSLFPSKVEFGTLPLNCFEEKIVEFTHFAEEDSCIKLSVSSEMSHDVFLLKNAQAEDPRQEISWGDNAAYLKYTAGDKLTVSLVVRFHPKEIANILDKGVVECHGKFIIECMTERERCSKKIAESDLRGLGAYGKFQCPNGSDPFVITATGYDEPFSREFSLRNVGVIPLTVNLRVTNLSSSDENKCFTVPKSIDLPVGQVVRFEIIFNPRAGDHQVRSRLIMNLSPNGCTNFDVELVGILYPQQMYTSSRSSVKSGSSATSKGVDQAVKLTASDRGLSWVATPLNKTQIQGIQLKLISDATHPVRAAIVGSSNVFQLMNERGEAISRMKKLLKPNVQVTINVAFRPDAVGPHHDKIEFHLKSGSAPSIVFLSGYGGCPNLRIENTMVDLIGNKMVKLNYPRNEDSFVYTSQFQITNYGNTPGFVMMTLNPSVPSIARSFKAFPLNHIVEPKSNITISVSQQIGRGELAGVLAGQELQKIGSLDIVMGDEPSLRRFQRCIGKLGTWGLAQQLVDAFPYHHIEINTPPESKEFENKFLSSLKKVEVVIVLEKFNNQEQTVIDLDESAFSFMTLSETVIGRTSDVPMSENSTVDGRSRRKSPCPEPSSHDLTAQKVKAWLRRVE